jgi:hypothetical protein
MFHWVIVPEEDHSSDPNPNPNPKCSEQETVADKLRRTSLTPPCWCAGDIKWPYIMMVVVMPVMMRRSKSTKGMFTLETWTDYQSVLDVNDISIIV